MEQELRTAQARLEFLLTASPIAIYSDKPLPGYPTTFISPNVVQLLGFTPEAVCQPGWYEEHLHPGDTDRMAESLDQILAGDMSVYEYRLRHRDGRYRWIRDRTHLVRDDDGQPLEIVGSLEDITDVRQADARFRAMADAAPQGIWMADVEFGLLYANQAELKNLGMTWEQARGQGGRRCVQPDDEVQQAADWTQAIQAGKPWSGAGTIHRDDGTTIDYRAWGAPILDDEGNVVAVVGQTADVTLEREAQEELRGSNEFKSALLDASPAIIVGLDDRGSVTLWNAAAERILGWSAADVVGGPAPALFRDDQPALEWPPKAAITNIQMQPRRKDGEAVDLTVSVAPLTDRFGTAIGGIAVAIDVTDQKHAEAERARVMGVLDDEARAREELNAVVSRLVARAAPEEAADAICDELVAMPAVTVAAVIAFDHDGTATPLAFRGPAGSPVTVGQQLPAKRAEYLREQAEHSTWVEVWRHRGEDGGYGRRWTEIGLVSAAYLPLYAHGEMAGAIIVGPRRRQARGCSQISSRRCRSWLPFHRRCWRPNCAPVCSMESCAGASKTRSTPRRSSRSSSPSWTWRPRRWLATRHSPDSRTAPPRTSSSRRRRRRALASSWSWPRLP